MTEWIGFQNLLVDHRGGLYIHTLACRSGGVRGSMTRPARRWCWDHHLKDILMVARWPREPHEHRKDQHGETQPPSGPRCTVCYRTWER